MRNKSGNKNKTKILAVGIVLIIISIILFFIPSEYHAELPLLAVTEINDTAIRGTIADINIEITPGNGKIFVNTFPISKLDTVVSTRLAKEYACEYLKKDCSKYNFFYEINSPSQVIGGPSAGLAMTLGTIAAFKKIKLKSIAMTGTINSGGTIGVVGGVKEKIDAAKKDGIRTVLVPAFTRIKYQNKTISPEEYGKIKGINVISVMTLDDALSIIGIKKEKKKFTTSKEYIKKMRTISDQLCNEAKFYYNETGNINETIKEINKTLNETDNNSVMHISLIFKREGIKKLRDAKKNSEIGRYYASASFCFGASIDLSYSYLLEKNITNATKYIINLTKKISEFNDTINAKKINTIYDLQTMMIVRERIDEAAKLINKTNNVTNATDKLYYYTYAKQRLETARLWSYFFNPKGERINLNKNSLRESCQTKIMEVQTRYQYVKEFFPYALGNNLEEAYKYQERGNYALCLFSASKAKAEGDILLSLMGVNETEAKTLLESKLSIIENKIGEQKNFPLLAYSYYEYAKALKDSDVSSALLYAEYSLELADLSIYFPKKESIAIDFRIIRILILGIGLGFIMSSYFYQMESEPRKKKRKV